MLRTLIIVAAIVGGFGYLLDARNIADPEPIVWLLPAACAISIGVLWD